MEIDYTFFKILNFLAHGTLESKAKKNHTMNAPAGNGTHVARSRGIETVLWQACIVDSIRLFEFFVQF